jgi:hypothetical protein
VPPCERRRGQGGNARGCRHDCDEAKEIVGHPRQFGSERYGHRHAHRCGDARDKSGVVPDRAVNRCHDTQAPVGADEENEDPAVPIGPKVATTRIAEPAVVKACSPTPWATASFGCVHLPGTGSVVC